jgi:hypothetical protein
MGDRFTGTLLAADNSLTEINKVALDLLAKANLVSTAASNAQTSADEARSAADGAYPVEGSTATGRYIKFPGGLMMQCGSTTVTTNTLFSPNYYSSTDTVVTFPTPFASAPLSVTISVGPKNLTVGSAFLSNRSGSNPVSATGFAVNVWMSDNAAVYPVYWQAWGPWE